MLILEGNPVCANNSKDTTRNVQNQTSACVFPGISDKMNSVNVNEKNHYQATKLSYTRQVVTTCHVIKKETCCSHVQPTFLNITVCDTNVRVRGVQHFAHRHTHKKKKIEKRSHAVQPRRNKHVCSLIFKTVPASVAGFPKL